MSQDVYSGFPKNPISVPLSGYGPVTVTISVSGASLSGYQPSGTAALQYYDPTVGRSVTQNIPIGGSFSPTFITVTTGSLVSTENWTGQLTISANTDVMLRTAVPGGFLGSPLSDFFKSVVNIAKTADAGLSYVYSVPGYYVTVIDQSPALDGGIGERELTGRRLT